MVIEDVASDLGPRGEGGSADQRRQPLGKLGKRPTAVSTPARRNRRYP